RYSLCMDDWTLLRAYADEGDESAFAALVERHISLVYHAAYRQIGEVPGAEEIAQSVFAKLAANAGTLRTNGSLAAWLYRVACREAIDFQRRESVRKRRHQQFAETVMHPIEDHEAQTRWPEVAPLLDEAMQSLSEV